MLFHQWFRKTIGFTLKIFTIAKFLVHVIGLIIFCLLIMITLQKLLKARRALVIIGLVSNTNCMSETERIRTRDNMRAILLAYYWTPPRVAGYYITLIYIFITHFLQEITCDFSHNRMHDLELDQCVISCLLDRHAKPCPVRKSDQRCHFAVWSII